MAGFATQNRFAGYPHRSAKARHALRLETDHLIGRPVKVAPVTTAVMMVGRRDPEAIELGDLLSGDRY